MTANRVYSFFLKYIGKCIKINRVRGNKEKRTVFQDWSHGVPSFQGNAMKMVTTNKRIGRTFPTNMGTLKNVFYIIDVLTRKQLVR